MLRGNYQNVAHDSGINTCTVKQRNPSDRKYRFTTLIWCFANQSFSMSCFYHLHQKVEEYVGGAFEKYGRFIAKYPWHAIIFVLVVDIGFGIGLLRLTRDQDLEQYAPTDSTAMKHRELMYGMFNVDTSTNFYAQSLINLGNNAIVIAQRKDGGNMLNSATFAELVAVRDFVIATNVSSEGNIYTFSDICAKRFSKCYVDGEYILENDFITARDAGTVSYPIFTSSSGEIFTIDSTFAGTEASGGYLTNASAVRFIFNLANTNQVLAKKWADAFLDRIKSHTSTILYFEYAHSDSLDEELNANIQGDIVFFAVTFTLITTFSGLVLIGGNGVSNRYSIAQAAVLSTGLAIVAALGFVSAVGVMFASIVGTMPFLIIGIGVDDMFILMSGLAATSSKDDIESRIGKTMRTSGIAITITSLTDVIAFCAGASSVFPAVRNFSWYTGTAILFCYLNYVTFYVGCMTLNEQRVTANRHFFTCKKIKSKEDAEKEGKSRCFKVFCTGSPHKSREEIEGPLEKYPKRLLTKIVLSNIGKGVIIVSFIVFVSFSLYGAASFEEDFRLKDLVSPDSYFYTYNEASTALYRQSSTISLNVRSGVDYMLSSTLQEVNSLRDKVRNDTGIDDSFFLSWLHAYMGSASYDISSMTNFITGLQTFLATTAGNLYVNDVTINGNTITASRFHVLTENIVKSSDRANLMVRVREIVETSSLPVFAYAPDFIFVEQFVAIFPQTMQTLGICVAVVFLITAIFLPLPIMILFITVTVVLIMASVIGFMHFWGLTLSSITMIHIIMCVGFSVDFATHVCHAYAQADGETRNKKVAVAIDHAGGPIFNGALSTILGVVMLAFSKSFIFVSFFKVMFMVMVFGLLYSVLLLPVLLSLVGPHYEHDGEITKTDGDKTSSPEKTSQVLENTNV